MGEWVKVGTSKKELGQVKDMHASEEGQVVKAEIVRVRKDV